MPGTCPTKPSKPLSPCSRRALQRGIAILVCLVAFDTAATEARPLEFCPGGRDVAAKVLIGALASPLVPREAVALPSVAQALRVVSALVIGTSQQSQAVAVQVATIIGFRG